MCPFRTFLVYKSHAVVTFCLADLWTFMVAKAIIGCHGSMYFGENRGVISVPDDIPPLSTSVDLSHNRITNLTSSIFGHLAFCLWLDLGYNQISVIQSGAFTGLFELKSLDLFMNHISKLEENMFSPLRNLEVLILQRAGVAEIQAGAFSGLINVQTLSLPIQLSEYS